MAKFLYAVLCRTMAVFLVCIMFISPKHKDLGMVALTLLLAAWFWQVAEAPSKEPTKE